jgi:hypothetical protein
VSEWHLFWASDVPDAQPEPRLSKAFANLSTEWEELLAGQEAKLGLLLEQIRKKKEEVDSLRDGVSTLFFIKKLLERKKEV